MTKKNILVFPCGSEVALEVHRSMVHSAHFRLVGGSSVADHGRFVFENYIDGLPFLGDAAFLEQMRQVVVRERIDAIYPALDPVIDVLKRNEAALGCRVVGSPAETSEVCVSKRRTYRALADVVKTPRTYGTGERPTAADYPVFAKPDVGYGSRGAQKIANAGELAVHLEKYPGCVLMECLPGEEYTVDCFTDAEGHLLVAKPRTRGRISNGISVHTEPVEDNGEFLGFAKRINAALRFEGAWFFQLKRDGAGTLTLLEVASRLGGSSGLWRPCGINFALMTLYAAFRMPVAVLENRIRPEMDRALDTRYRLDLSYDEVFVDFDDCLSLDGRRVNPVLAAFLYDCLGRGVRTTLLTRHDDEKLGLLEGLLEQLRVRPLFDRILHIGKTEEKADYIDNRNAIFIDDSFAERQKVSERCGIPVFGPDMAEALWHDWPSLCEKQDCNTPAGG